MYKPLQKNRFPFHQYSTGNVRRAQVGPVRVAGHVQVLGAVQVPPLRQTGEHTAAIEIPINRLSIMNFVRNEVSLNVECKERFH